MVQINKAKYKNIAKHKLKKSRKVKVNLYVKYVLFSM